MTTSTTKLIMVPIRIFKYLFLSVLSFACTSPYHIQREYLPKYQSGKFYEAESNLKKIIHKEIPGGSYRRSNNAVWYLLNLATIEFARGNVHEAIKTYHLAEDAIDYYSQPSSLDLTTELLLEDPCSAFSLTPKEQVLAKIYFALALIQNNDLVNAEAVLRGAKEKLPFNPLCDYLLAHLLALRGDYSNATILYKKISLSKDSKVIVLCHNGNVPIKKSSMAPASDASLVALELLLHNDKRPIALSSLPGISVPILIEHPANYPKHITVQIGKECKSLKTIYSVAKDAKEALNKERGTIIARGVARYLIRRSAILAANEHSESLGTYVDLGCLIANAMTEADTRSWETLPYSIDLAEFTTESKEVDLFIQTENRYAFTLNLKEGDLCIINIFNVHPGVQNILVPNKFKIKREV